MTSDQAQVWNNGWNPSPEAFQRYLEVELAKANIRCRGVRLEHMLVSKRTWELATAEPAREA